MSYYVNWSERAVDSLKYIKEYISQVSPNKSERIASELVIYARQLTSFPFIGKIDDRLGEDIRTLIKNDYIIAYRVNENRVEIVDVLCSKQDFISISIEAESITLIWLEIH